MSRIQTAERSYKLDKPFILKIPWKVENFLVTKFNGASENTVIRFTREPTESDHRVQVRWGLNNLDSPDLYLVNKIEQPGKEIVILFSSREITVTPGTPDPLAVAAAPPPAGGDPPAGGSPPPAGGVASDVWLLNTLGNRIDPPTLGTQIQTRDNTANSATNLGHVRTDIGDIRTRVSAIEADAQALRVSLQAVEGDAETIRGNVAGSATVLGVRPGIEAIRDRITAIEADAESIRLATVAMEADVDAIRIDISAQRAETAAIRASTDLITPDVDSSRVSLGSIEGDASVLRDNVAGTPHLVGVRPAVQAIRDSATLIAPDAEAVRLSNAAIQSDADDIRVDADAIRLTSGIIQGEVGVIRSTVQAVEIQGESRGAIAISQIAVGAVRGVFPDIIPASGKGVVIKADPANTHNVYIGGSVVTTTNGYLLEPGSAVTLYLSNLNALWHISTTAGQRLSLITEV